MRKLHLRHIRHTAATGGLALALGCGAAAAQVDPLLQRAEMSMGPNEFLLTSENDEARLTYDQRRDVRICNRSGRVAGGVAPAEPDREERQVPLQVKHDGGAERIAPGACLIVQAKALTISPTEPLEQGWMLRGSVETAEPGALSARDSGGLKKQRQRSATASTARTEAGADTTRAATMNARQSSPQQPEEFRLTSEEDEARLTYDERRDVRICNRSGRVASGVAPAEPDREERQVPLEVEHNGVSERIAPGSCAIVQARTLTISPTEPLETGWMLRGTVESAEAGTLSAGSASTQAEQRDAQGEQRIAQAEPHSTRAEQQNAQAEQQSAQAEQQSTQAEQQSASRQQQQSAAAGTQVKAEEVVIRTWPDTARKAAEAMIAKYGSPQEVTQRRLVWHDNGPFKRTVVIAEEIDHDFPMPHKDVLEQVVAYEVPADKFDELARFDGSVIVERTRGEISSRCHEEAANLVALNLAHEIVTGKRSVGQARETYARTALQMRNGESPALAQSLQFTPPQTAGHSDEASPLIRQAQAEESGDEAAETPLTGAGNR